jgi:hypothetical protein
LLAQVPVARSFSGCAQAPKSHARKIPVAPIAGDGSKPPHRVDAEPAKYRT